MKIYAVKLNDGYVVTENIGNKSYFHPKLQNLYFDGNKPQNTFHKDWFYVKELPQIIEKDIKVPPTNHRYELIDKTMTSEKIPDVLYRDECCYENDEYGWTFKKEFAHLSSLYEYKRDEHPDIKESIDFEIEIVFEIDEMKEGGKFSYSFKKDNLFCKNFGEITEKDVQYQLLDKIFFPDFMLCHRPCKLTSRQSYDIIRKFVKDNINSKYAEITSDYDFCFAVAKKVPLHESYLEKYEIKKANGKSYKDKKYREKLVKDRLIKRVFEMTPIDKPYSGYTPIDGFSGQSTEDLKNNIDNFLNNLITRINEPLIDCPHCEGLGVILNKDDK